MLTSPLTLADLAPSMLAADALGDDATDLLGCDDFAAWCDARRDAWVADLEAAAEVSL